jgi:hypothetical protein
MEKMRVEPEDALRAISNALFPPPRMEGDFLVGGDAYINLEGARIDLRRMGADPVCIHTIERVQGQLLEVSEILQKAGFQVRQR